MSSSEVDRSEVIEASLEMAKTGARDYSELFEYTCFSEINETIDEAPEPDLKPKYLTAAYLTPKNLTPVLHKAFSAIPDLPHSTINQLRKEDAGQINVALLPFQTKSVTYPLATRLKSACEDMAAEYHEASFCIVGLQLHYNWCGSVLITPSRFVDLLSKRLGEPLANVDSAEEDTNTSSTHFPQLILDAGRRQKIEELNDLSDLEMMREIAKSLVGMLILPSKDTHPTIKQQLFKSPTA